MWLRSGLKLVMSSNVNPLTLGTPDQDKLNLVKDHCNSTINCTASSAVSRYSSMTPLSGERVKENTVDNFLCRFITRSRPQIFWLNIF